MAEEDGRRSLSPESDAFEAFFRSIPPALVLGSLLDEDGSDGALDTRGRFFSHHLRWFQPWTPY